MSNTDHRSANRYPELRHFASVEEANRSLKAWQAQQLKQARFWIALLVFTIVIGGFVFAMMILIRQWVSFPTAMYGGIVGGVTGGSGPIALTWLWRRQCHAFLRQELVSRGIPICLKCGYDLRGQTVARCPECGTGFDEQLIRVADDDDGPEPFKP